MKKLISIAVLSLSLSGFALAEDRAGDFSWVVPSVGQPYDGQTLSGRADHPAPTPTMSSDQDTASIEFDANGRA
ncbi:MAG: hypothetical protein GWP66_03890 [Gammaproteobacteria bacterium]|jgi:hypothetical protein|nr:hypothetical protein [Gammaproteobacteria bacterium]